MEYKSAPYTFPITLDLYIRYIMFLKYTGHRPYTLLFPGPFEVGIGVPKRPGSNSEPSEHMDSAVWTVT